MRCLTKIGIRSSRVDHGVNLTLADDGARIDNTAWFGGDWQRLAGQRRLIDLDGISVEKARIRRNDISQPKTDDVAWDQFARLRIHPFTVPFYFREDRQPGLQCGNGIAGLVFFPESNQSIGKEQHKDDEKIQPVSDNAGEDHRNFNHPGNGTPEVGKKLQVFVGLFFLELVRSIPRLSFGRLGLSQAIR